MRARPWRSPLARVSVHWHASACGCACSRPVTQHHLAPSRPRADRPPDRRPRRAGADGGHGRRCVRRRAERGDQRAVGGDVRRPALPRSRHQDGAPRRGLERDLGGPRSCGVMARLGRGRGSPAARGLRSRSGRPLPVGAVRPAQRRGLRGRGPRVPRRVSAGAADHALERGQPRRRADGRPARPRGRLLQRRPPGLPRLHPRGGGRHRRAGHALLGGRVPARARRDPAGLGAARLLRHDLLHDVRASRLPGRGPRAGVAHRDRRHRRAAHARRPGLAASATSCARAPR